MENKNQTLPLVNNLVEFFNGNNSLPTANEKGELVIDDNDSKFVVNEEELPSAIFGAIDTISSLEEKIRQSSDEANSVLNYINNDMKRYKDKSFIGIHWRSGSDTDMIEDLQKAVEKQAKAQQISTEAMQKSFEFQRKLSEATKYLFAITTTNSACVRTAIKVIAGKLEVNDGSVSDLVKSELEQLLHQLKMQEDMQHEQELLKEKAEKNERTINEHDENIKTNTKKITTNQENIAQNRSAIDANSGKIDANIANIAQNASNIGQNKANINANTENIQKNTARIDELYQKTSSKLAINISIIAIILSIISIGCSVFTMLNK